eukprot:scaffold102577_cov18-Tisochrysis_lutea.AAC.2
MSGTEGYCLAAPSLPPQLTILLPTRTMNSRQFPEPPEALKRAWQASLDSLTSQNQPSCCTPARWVHAAIYAR